MYNHVKFFVVDRIILFCFIEFLTKKGDRSTLLTKNSSYTYTSGITSDIEGFIKLRVLKNRSGRHFCFDVSKGFSSGQGQIKLTFFRQSMIGVMIELNPMMNLLYKQTN